MSERSRCDDVREDLAELAAGVLPGEQRARALAHVAGCPSCRRELDSAAVVLDELLLLAPEREPAPGFETAVLAALTDRSERPRWRVAAVAAAAALLAGLLGAGAGWWAASDESPVVAAELRAAGASQTAGRVYAYDAPQPWLFVSLYDAPDSGRYAVQVVTTDDQRVDVGWCEVRDGRGSWGRTVDIEVDRIRAVRLTRPGTAPMRANFD